MFSDTETVEMTWVPDCGRVAIWNSRQPEGGQPRVLFTPAAVEAFIGQVRAGDYGTGTEPPPRTVPLGDTLGDRFALAAAMAHISVPAGVGHRANLTARRAPAGTRIQGGTRCPRGERQVTAPAATA
jgi:hypothetical protein